MRPCHYCVVCLLLLLQRGAANTLSGWLSHCLPLHEGLELLQQLHKQQHLQQQQQLQQLRQPQHNVDKRASLQCCPSALMQQRLLLQHGAGEEALALATEVELTAAAAAAAAASTAGPCGSSELMKAATRATVPAWLSLGLQGVASAAAAGLLPVATHSLQLLPGKGNDNDSGSCSGVAVLEKQKALSLLQQINMNVFNVLLHLGRLDEAAVAAG